MNLSAQIADLRATRAKALEAQTAIMTKSFNEKRTTTPEEQADYDARAAEVQALDADLDRLEKLEKSMRTTAVEVTQTPAAPGQTQEPKIEVKSNAKSLEKGEGFGRWARVVAKANGNLMDAERIAKAMYPEDKTLETVIKAAVAGGSTTDTAWAKPLVNTTNYAGDFIEFLRPQTILGKFGSGGIPGLRRVPFNIKIVSQTSGAVANWVGEGKGKPLTKWGYGNVTLGMTKLAAICALTDELVRTSDPAADTLARDELARAIIAKMDSTFVGNAAATTASPAGILNGVTPITASASTDAYTALQADVKAIFGAYIAAGMTPADGVWIMSSTAALKLSMLQNPLGQSVYPAMNMTGGTFAGLPVIVSDYVAAGTVILVNASDVFLADDGSVQIDMSREASLEMNDAPTQDGVAGTGAAMVSMFQANMVAIRAERYVSWAKRRAAAVQAVTGATVWA